MSELVTSRKACAQNPLKSSAPLGAALAYLGVEGAVPLFHGAQGCTSFALVLAVRHYRESIPLQTTALSEVATILGGRDNLDEAVAAIAKRLKPSLIGIASTALTELRGEDVRGDLKSLCQRRPELAGTKIVYASTPDYLGALEDGWARATTALIEALTAPAPATRTGRQLNVLPGVHLTPADLDELRETIVAFGLTPFFLPDLSGSLDGHVPDAYVGTSLGGAPVEGIAAMGAALHTLAVGEQMRAPAEALHARTHVPYTVLPSLTGLAGSDALVALLTLLSGNAAPPSLRRRRSQLVDALLDAHFSFTGRRVAVAADPDLLFALASLLEGLGAEVVAAVASTDRSPLLTGLQCAEVQVGDLADLEELARARGAELLVTNSQGRGAAERLGVPLVRVGFPIFDRLGAAHRLSVGYRGTRELVFELGNALLSSTHSTLPGAHSLDSLPLPTHSPDLTASAPRTASRSATAARASSSSSWATPCSLRLTHPTHTHSTHCRSRPTHPT